MVKLSILILSIESRNLYLLRLLNILNIQIQQNDYKNIVEILVLDDKKDIQLGYKIKSVGEKRNLLLKQATGEYSVFIDDDDMPTVNYIETIINTLNNNTNVDAIGINKLCYNNKDISYIQNDLIENIPYRIDTTYYTHIDHLCVIKTDIAKLYAFDDVFYNEQNNWIININKNIKNVITIKEPIYLYFINIKNNNTKLENTLLIKYNIFNNNTQNLIDTIKLSSKTNQFYIIGITTDFKALQQAEIYILYHCIILYKQCLKSKINAINEYISEVTIEWDYVLQLDDSKICKINAWDRLIHENIISYFTLKDKICFFNNAFDKSYKNTYPIIGRKIYNKNNFILNTDYINDLNLAYQELTIVANNLTEHVYFSDILFENNIEINYDLNDIKTFKQHKKNNFNLLSINNSRPFLKKVREVHIIDKIKNCINANKKFEIYNTRNNRLVYESIKPQPLNHINDKLSIGNLLYDICNLNLIEL